MIALCTGTESDRFQIRQVSRWVVTPTVAMSRAVSPDRPITSSIAPRIAVQSWAGSSSTQPCRGKMGVSGFDASATIRPSASTSTALALLDPSSRART